MKTAIDSKRISDRCTKLSNMTPVFFADQNEFRKWLEDNHKTKTELVVGYYKVSTGRPTMSWSQSVDQALCFGWIDGIRRSIDEESYCIRFTPRKPTSIWSNINIKKIEELTEKGLMTEAGLQAYSKRKDTKSGVYSFENDPTILPDGYDQIFKANPVAWDFFTSQAPSYRKAVFRWIMSAKQEETRLSRLNKLIQASEEQKRLS
jgi:uncharacterized protein YdeI (YjbR/CyaY-like superfamily)